MGIGGGARGWGHLHGCPRRPPYGYCRGHSCSKEGCPRHLGLSRGDTPGLWLGEGEGGGGLTTEQPGADGLLGFAATPKARGLAAFTAKVKAVASG